MLLLYTTSPGRISCDLLKRVTWKAVPKKRINDTRRLQLNGQATTPSRPQRPGYKRIVCRSNNLKSSLIRHTTARTLLSNHTDVPQPKQCGTPIESQRSTSQQIKRSFPHVITMTSARPASSVGEALTPPNKRILLSFREIQLTSYSKIIGISSELFVQRVICDTIVTMTASVAVNGIVQKPGISTLAFVS